ncbi:MAG: hypothetical protein AAGC60_21205 [Acidobacteriota bacterium]
MTRSRCSLFFILLLCALPATGIPASLDAEAPGCALAEREAATARFLGGSAVEPIPAESSLFVDPSILPQGPIKIHYLVDGAPYVVESADLAAARAPQRDHPLAGLEGDTKAAFDLAVPTVLELLTLRPDLVRRLHRMDGEGTPIEIEIRTGDLTLERLTFDELRTTSTSLRDQGALAVYLLTEVDGQGAVRPPMPRRTTKNGCGFCSPTSSCDDVGPYDDGKGDCTTCGEYGECDPGGCDCSKVINDYWTDWFVTNITYVGPYGCVDYSFVPDSRALRAQVTYRRNRIQVTRTCPNCPSCAGCYNTQAVIDFQTQTLYCYIDQFQSCLPGDFTIGTWELCP